MDRLEDANADFLASLIQQSELSKSLIIGLMNSTLVPLSLMIDKGVIEHDEALDRLLSLRSKVIASSGDTAATPIDLLIREVEAHKAMQTGGPSNHWTPIVIDGGKDESV